MKGTDRTLAALGILFAINTLNFLDRQILFAVAEPIRREWGLSDAALGALGTAFVVVYAVAGLPLGSWADRFSRRVLLGCATLSWSVLTAASGFARGFFDLVVLRMGVGVGEAVCAPAATSMIGDLVPPSRRARALSVFMLGLPVGIALGYLLGGWVAKNWGWRRAFFLSGLPGLVAGVAAFSIAEPVRGHSDGRSAGAAPTRTAVASVLANPTMRWIILSGALHNLVMYALSSFLSPFLVRAHGMNVWTAGALATWIYGIAGGVGLALGGFAGDLAKRRRDDGRMWLATWAVGIAACVFGLGLLRSPGRLPWFGSCTAMFCALMYVYYANVYATIQDVVGPERRGTAMAVYFFAMYALGGALGPMGAGLLSDRFARLAASNAGLRAFSPSDLEPFRAAGLAGALAILPVLGLLLAVTLATGARAFARDRDRLAGAVETTQIRDE